MLRAAPDDCTVLNSWESCWTGSNRLERVSTKKATVPTVSDPSATRWPPSPTTRAVQASEAPSITGRYQACNFTERMWASYRPRLRWANRSTSTSSRP